MSDIIYAIIGFLVLFIAFNGEPMNIDLAAKAVHKTLAEAAK